MSRTVKSAIILLTAAAIVGCAAPMPPVQGSASKTASPVVSSERKIQLHAKSTLRDRLPAGMVYALLGPVDGGWDVVKFSRVPPFRQDKQEVFMVSEDFKRWESTIEASDLCRKGRTDYSVCTSSLAERNLSPGSLGAEAVAAMLSVGMTLVVSGKPMHYDEDAVEKAIFSIPGSASERLNQFLMAEKGNEEAAVQLAKQRRMAARDECFRNNAIRLKEAQVAAEPARAKQAAGHKLSPMDLAQLRQLEMYESTSCWLQ